jgi:hypothetical protein
MSSSGAKISVHFSFAKGIDKILKMNRLLIYSFGKMNTYFLSPPTPKLNFTATTKIQHETTAPNTDFASFSWHGARTQL